MPAPGGKEKSAGTKPIRLCGLSTSDDFCRLMSMQGKTSRPPPGSGADGGGVAESGWDRPVAGPGYPECRSSLVVRLHNLVSLSQLSVITGRAAGFSVKTKYRKIYGFRDYLSRPLITVSSPGRGVSQSGRSVAVPWSRRPRSICANGGLRSVRSIEIRTASRLSASASRNCKRQRIESAAAGFLHFVNLAFD